MERSKTVIVCGALATIIVTGAAGIWLRVSPSHNTHVESVEESAESGSVPSVYTGSQEPSAQQPVESGEAVSAVSTEYSRSEARESSLERESEDKYAKLGLVVEDDNYVRAFRSQPVDEAWAQSMEPAIESYLAGTGLEVPERPEIECRTTICRARMAHTVTDFLPNGGPTHLRKIGQMLEPLIRDHLPRLSVVSTVSRQSPENDLFYTIVYLAGTDVAGGIASGD